MNNIKSTNIHSFCRTCLSELQKYSSTLAMDNMYNVHESRELSQWIVNCLPVPLLNNNDYLPNFVCTGCYQKLQSFYEFREMSTRSMRTLWEMLGLPANRKEEEKQPLDWLETPNKLSVERSKESENENQDVDDKNLVLRTIMETGQFEPEINIEEQKSQFPDNFVDATMPEVTINNEEMLENAIDTLDISSNSNAITKQLRKPQPITIKFQCKECKRSYASQDNLDAHMRIHRGLRPFQCQKCARSFNRAYHLRRHIEGVHSESVHKQDSEQDTISKVGKSVADSEDDDDGDDAEDDIDNIDDDYDENTDDDEEYKSDNESDGTDVSIASTEKLTAKSKKGKRSPKTTATKKKKSTTPAASTCPSKKKFIYQCKECNRSYASEETRAAHMRTHQGLRPFPCTSCPKSFKRAYHLQMHMISFHTEKPEEIACTVEGCGKSFRLETSYRTHYRLKHSETPPQWKTYICEDCGRVLKTVTALREHRYTHAPREEYPYHCEQCDKRYSSQRTYKEHLMRHAGIKRFVCPYCGMRKTTRNELKTHVNYHTKEKQWPCPLCPSVFNSPANLSSHNRNVHIGLREHVCRYCNQSFGKIDTLRHHEMRHTGEKPHECHICHKRFIQMVALKTHMKTHAKYGVAPVVPAQQRQRQRQAQIQSIHQEAVELQQPMQLQQMQPQQQQQQEMQQRTQLPQQQAMTPVHLTQQQQLQQLQ